MEVLAHVADPRRKRGRRFGLVFLLAVAVVCVLAGAKNFRGVPVAIATFLPGAARHQEMMRSGSVVASRKPCLVTGTFSPGMHGNTGQPMRAYASAARSAAPSRGYQAFTARLHSAQGRGYPARACPSVLSQHISYYGVATESSLIAIRADR